MSNKSNNDDWSKLTQSIPVIVVIMDIKDGVFSRKERAFFESGMTYGQRLEQARQYLEVAKPGNFAWAISPYGIIYGFDEYLAYLRCCARHIDSLISDCHKGGDFERAARKELSRQGNVIIESEWRLHYPGQTYPGYTAEPTAAGNRKGQAAMRDPCDAEPAIPPKIDARMRAAGVESDDEQESED